MFNDLVNLFFPNTCLSCTASLIQDEKYLCTVCFYTLPITNHHFFPENNSMINRFYPNKKIQQAVALYKFKKQGKVAELLYQLKYKNNPSFGIYIGYQYGLILKEMSWIQSYDMIIPVPIHRHKLLKRGYNQSAMLAKGLSRALQIPWKEDCLKKNRFTTTQTKKERIQRWENIKNSIELNNIYSIQNKCIILIDDVITTGATLNACIDILYKKSQLIVPLVIAEAVF